MDTYNSFSEVIKRFSQLNANSLEIFEGINKAVSSDQDAVTITIDLFGKDTPEGEETIQTYQIPSFSFLDREIKRLENNLKALSGFKKEYTPNFPFLEFGLQLKESCFTLGFLL